MKSRIVTTIPTFNSERFLVQTLQSLANQTVRPDRVIVIDDGSKDGTEAIVKGFKPIQCEWVQNPKTLGLFGNFNRCLDFADQGEYLQILHADDTLEPEFYQTMVGVLDDCPGLAMAWCLDERIDENNQRLSISGKPDGAVEVLAMDDFLKRKAEIGNQAFAATLLKTCARPVPCRFPMDMPILGDMVYWAHFGKHCQKLVHVHRLLCKYRWHGSNATNALAPSIQALILDEWRTMEMNEALRGGSGMSLYRSMKLRGLLAVRSGIKAKRFRQQNNLAYSRQIVSAAKNVTGTPLWLAGQVLVELRDLIVYTILGRPRHPKNVFS
ncbi:MAG TPA: glycosyltransferase [Clostridia bacterium]|nr:glycosyltransferase [Clostridia bacterium]